MKSRISMILAGVFLMALAVIAQSRNFQNTKYKSVQTVTVKITGKGYKPKSLMLKRDVPAVITFIRQTGKTCGTEVVIPEYKISQPLPLNKPVKVKFTPTKSGELKFTCGMDMLRGKLIVE